MNKRRYDRSTLALELFLTFSFSLTLSLLSTFTVFDAIPFATISLTLM